MPLENQELKTFIDRRENSDFWVTEKGRFDDSWKPRAAMQHTLSRPDGRHVFDLDSKGTDLIVEKEQSNVHAKLFSKFLGRKSLHQLDGHGRRYPGATTVMTISLHIHGAAGTVTDSCYRLRTSEGELLVECGMFQGPRSLCALNYRHFLPVWRYADQVQIKTASAKLVDPNCFSWPRPVR